MFENFKIVEYRKRKFEEKCREIENLVGGMKQYYISPASYKENDLIFNESPYGKTNHFVENILGWVEKYVQYRIYRYGLDGSWYEELEDLPFEPGPNEVGHVINDPLGKWVKEYYEAFIYIALGLGIYNDETRQWTTKPGRWESLSERISLPFNHYEEADFYKAIVSNDLKDRWSVGYGPALQLQGIYPSLAIAYQIVTGKKLFSLLTEDELALAKKTMSDEEKVIVDEMLIDADEHVKEECEYPELLIQYFSDIEYFKKCCRILLTRSVEIYKNCDVKNELDNGICYYLDECRLASWQNDDKFFASYIYLEKAEELIDTMNTWGIEYENGED